MGYQRQGYRARTYLGASSLAGGPSEELALVGRRLVEEAPGTESAVCQRIRSLGGDIDCRNESRPDQTDLYLAISTPIHHY